MSTTLHDAVFYQVLAQALNKANPSGLPSNLTLQGIAMPTETITVQTVIQATTTQLGYAYGSGQRVDPKTFNGTTLAGWTVSGVSVDPGIGTPAPAFAAPGSNAYAWRDDHTVFSVYTLEMNSSALGDFYFGCDDTGAGQMFRLDTRGGTNLAGFATTNSWTSWNAPAAGFAAPPNTWVQVVLTVSAGSVTADCTWSGGSASVGPYTLANTTGTAYGMQGDGGGGTTYFDNLSLHAASGTAIPFTQPYGAAWLVRLFAQIPSGSSVSLSAAIGGGTSQPITMLDPAQTLGYGDLFRWSPAIALGPVGIGPWGTPSGWPDAAATWLGPVEGSTGNVPVGGWLLRKWVCNPSKQTITVSLAADNQANVFIDGTLIVQSSTYASTTQGSVLLPSGWHLVAISALNYGSAPNPTGVLLSLADPQGNVLEDGSTDARVGATWETTGFLDGTWTTVNSASDLSYQWGVIPASLMTSEDVSLTVTQSSDVEIHSIDCYTIAPWRWNQGALYDHAVSGHTPAQVAPVTTTQTVG